MHGIMANKRVEYSPHKHESNIVGIDIDKEI